MRNYILFILCMLVLSPLDAYSQDKKQFTVSGIVVDDSGEPFPGATVYVKNMPGKGTVSDLDGKFKIRVDANAVLVVQSVGMKSVETLINKDMPKLKIVLTEDSESLEEVVITGLSSQKKVSVVGAISSLDVSQIKTPATSLSNMIGGRLAGVITMQTSGEPGKNLSNFWIRGISTFGAGGGALVLIDGLEGNLNDIDPDDVESFSILKDASATAVYGVRGANGVVLVTTKRGGKDKLNITGRATVKMSHIKRLPEYLGAYDYALLANEARAMSGQEDLYTTLQLDLIRSGLDKDLYPDVNWTDEIMKRNSWQQNYYVSARGGGDIATYFLSLGYQDEGAAYRQEQNIFDEPLAYRRLTYRANIDMNLTKNTKLYFGVDGHISNYTTPGGQSTQDVWNAVRLLNPLMFPVVYSDGTMPTYGRDDLISPYVMLNHTGYRSQDNNRNVLTLKLSQKFTGALKGLTLSAQAMTEHVGNFNERRFISPNLYRASGRTSQGTLIKTLRHKQQDMAYSSNTVTYRKYYMESKANYNRSFGNHNVGALLFYYMEDAQGSNWGTDALGINAIPQRRQNLSGRLSYGYNNCYFIDGNFGYTGSAQFKKGDRFGFFPSIAVGWVPTAYKWVNKNMPWLSFFKIRASYGLAGNDQIGGGRFPYLTLIDHHAPVYWGYVGRGIREKQTGADNLTWEVAKKANLGIDTKFFKDKLSVTVDFFRDERDHIFQDRVTLPRYVGMVTFPKSNVGRMHSYGSDGNISYFHEINKKMNFTLRANYTFSQNIVDYFEENKLPYDYLSVTNKPYGLIRGYIAEGLFKSKEEINTSPDQQSSFGRVRPGDIKYRDVNGDGRITADDKVPLSYGNQVPRVMYGFGVDFNYKDLTVAVLFKGAAKVEYYRSGFRGNDAGWIPFYNGELGNVIKLANNPKNRWTPAWYSGTADTENPNAEFPRLSYGGNANNSQLSTFWKRNGSYLRFQELSLRYKLHAKPWIKKMGLSGIDLEFVTNNIFTIDKVKYFDPEQASYNGAAYPIPTTYTFQVYLKF
ncbi:SusC/RagA family TonB-linked outer membrane protein [Bacteroides pyogenes]|uniref:SusC/RagA family TonB-linked outer membrane protein n=1 Tax=Bacteroides pyogenes TaxID=310300 RepID=UPI004062E07B